jgi:hypothetical protein
VYSHDLLQRNLETTTGRILYTTVFDEGQVEGGSPEDLCFEGDEAHTVDSIVQVNILWAL